MDGKCVPKVVSKKRRINGVYIFLGGYLLVKLRVGTCGYIVHDHILYRYIYIYHSIILDTGC